MPFEIVSSILERVQIRIWYSLLRPLPLFQPQLLEVEDVILRLLADAESIVGQVGLRNRLVFVWGV